MSNKYVDFEYLKQNNPNPAGIQYKGLFGNRSLGKTHGVLKYLLDNVPDGQAIMILRRNQLELNFKPFVDKFSAAFNREWTIEGRTIIENHDQIKFYFGALSLAERAKHDNYDAPYVQHIIVDEAFAEKPNKKEYQQLQTWVTTLARRTGHPFHPMTIWLLGNSDYGYSPILDELRIFRTNGVKQKTKDGVYLFSEKESPEHVINVESPLIKSFDIRRDNDPLIRWSHLGACYGLFDVGHHLYIKKVDTAPEPYNFDTKDYIIRLALKKRGIPRVYVDDYDCMRFIDAPQLKLI